MTLPQEREASFGNLHISDLEEHNDMSESKLIIHSKLQSDRGDPLITHLSFDPEDANR